jgi:uncharacterized protein YecE (DUF72 family)
MNCFGSVRIGISGWRYKGWRGVLYPTSLAQRRELEFASRQFNSIELNGSFYSLQRPKTSLNGAADTPNDFEFAVKGFRYITHMLRLRDIRVPLANFFAQGLLRLGTKLGPILWQFPPNFKFQADHLEAFLSLLPKTHGEAATLGRRHDDRLGDRAWLKVSKEAPLRHALEIRHPSFACEEFIQLLRRHGIGLVVADTVEWPLLMDVTADFVYCRYNDKALDVWAKRVVLWAGGFEVRNGRRASSKDAEKRRSRDVYVYFDNDKKVRASFDAIQLRERVNLLCDSRKPA